MAFEPVIGLEIHIQLKTRRKMFCNCSAGTWGSEPNTSVCPVCLGLPGALPVLNQKAVEQAIKVGLALNCRINEQTYFERKNYFYPDLPKGYQISQYRAPLAVNGKITIQQFIDSKNRRPADNLTINVGITRVHLEEDTAKSIHSGDSTFLDFNKSGIPLLEIVSEPDIHSVEAAVAYTKEVQELVRRLGVSDANMEKGQMRLEANISLRPDRGYPSRGVTPRGDLPPYRVEIKNINSFRFLRGALEYEIERQAKALEKGQKLKQETRGYDEQRGATFVQRTKEEAHDYRYFPEPDIPPLQITDEAISRVRDGLPKLSKELIDQLIQTYKLPEKDATILVGDESRLDYFKRLVAEGMEPKPAASLVINRPEVLLKGPIELIQALKKEKSEEISDEGVLRKAVETVVAANPQPVKDLRSGKEVALKFLIGQVMRGTKGKANPQIVERLLREAL